MKLGFLGTGTISDAIIRGLCQTNLPISEIIISPRNADIAKKLADDFAQVTIASDNQAVVDGTDMVFLGLRAQIASETLTALRFRPQQKVVSLIATATAASVQQWTGGVATVLRAVPLPFVAQHQSMTSVYPGDADLVRLFDAIGGSVIAKTEHDLNLFMTAGSFMGVYYQFVETCNGWLISQGLPQAQTGPYLAKLFMNLAQQAQGEQVDFLALQEAYSTKGGTNEFIANAFADNGGIDALTQAIDAAFLRISQ